MFLCGTHVTGSIFKEADVDNYYLGKQYIAYATIRAKLKEFKQRVAEAGPDLDDDGPRYGRGMGYKAKQGDEVRGLCEWLETQHVALSPLVPVLFSGLWCKYGFWLAQWTKLHLMAST